jgi:hypothetical protein
MTSPSDSVTEENTPDRRKRMAARSSSVWLKRSPSRRPAMRMMFLIRIRSAPCTETGPKRSSGPGSSRISAETVRVA